MSPPGRPKGEYRSAQREGTPVSYAGIALLFGVAILVPLTGLPSFLVLLFAAGVGALLGVVTGTIPTALLAALPIRIVNLLENDLLQALPLYVLMGALMNRLPIADAIFQSSTTLLCRRMKDGWRIVHDHSS